MFTTTRQTDQTDVQAQKYPDDLSSPDALTAPDGRTFTVKHTYDDHKDETRYKLVYSPSRKMYLTLSRIHQCIKRGWSYTENRRGH
jgi:hypothetical protein